jgi:hypothetical protein
VEVPHSISWKGCAGQRHLSRRELVSLAIVMPLGPWGTRAHQYKGLIPDHDVSIRACAEWCRLVEHDSVELTRTLSSPRRHSLWLPAPATSA